MRIHGILHDDHIGIGVGFSQGVLKFAMRPLRSIQTTPRLRGARRILDGSPKMSDLDQFRSETRGWLEANCPPAMRRPMTSEEDTFWGGRHTKFSSEPQPFAIDLDLHRGKTLLSYAAFYDGKTELLKSSRAIPSH